MITADTARQAPLGKPVLWVLVAAVVLVCVGFVATWMFAGAAGPLELNLKRAPDLRRRERHLQLHRRLETPGARKRVDHGDDRRRRRADRAQVRQRLSRLADC